MKLRDRIRASKPKLAPVAVPGWLADDAEGLYVRVLSGAERFELEEWMATSRGPDGKMNSLLLMCKMVVLAAADAEGRPVFEPGDEDWLKDKDGPELLTIFQAAMRVNRMTKEDQEELTAHLRNGSNPLASGSVSPPTSA